MNAHAVHVMNLSKTLSSHVNLVSAAAVCSKTAKEPRAALANPECRDEPHSDLQSIQVTVVNWKKLCAEADAAEGGTPARSTAPPPDPKVTWVMRILISGKDD